MSMVYIYLNYRPVEEILLDEKVMWACVYEMTDFTVFFDNDGRRDWAWDVELGVT